MNDVELLAAVDAYLADHGIVLVNLDLGDGWYEQFLEWKYEIFFKWKSAQQKMRKK